MKLFKFNFNIKHEFHLSYNIIKLRNKKMSDSISSTIDTSLSKNTASSDKAG